MDFIISETCIKQTLGKTDKIDDSQPGSRPQKGASVFRKREREKGDGNRDKREIDGS